MLSLAFVFRHTITSLTERVWVTAQTCNPAALCFADPRQIVYSHTFRQRKSMSLDSTAGSVTQGRLTDRYEPANANVCVNASARCCILLHKAILPKWQSLPLITYAFFVSSLSILCNKLITRAKTLSFPNFTYCHWIDEIFILLYKVCQVGVLSVTSGNTEIRGCVIVRFLLHHNHVLVSD